MPSNTPHQNKLFDLSFPYHPSTSASERLLAIEQFMEVNGFSEEYMLDGPISRALEVKVAELFGKPAALWCPTGTLAQGIAAKIYALSRANHKLLLHPTSHLLLHEESGYEFAHGLEATVIGSWDETISAEQINDDGAAVFVELPQRHNGGLLPDWDELEKLKSKAGRLKIPLHVDGARLWSCRSHYQHRSYAEIASGFNSLYLSLYKDIGAIGGAMLLGDQNFIAEARVWRTRLGGLLVEPWPMLVDALRLIDDRVAQLDILVEKAQQLAASLSAIKRVSVTPVIPHVNMFHLELPCSVEVAQRARDIAGMKTGVWLNKRCWSYVSDEQCAMEIVVGENLLELDDSQFLRAVATMLEAIPLSAAGQ